MHNEFQGSAQILRIIPIFNVKGNATYIPSLQWSEFLEALYKLVRKVWLKTEIFLVYHKSSNTGDVMYYRD